MKDPTDPGTTELDLARRGRGRPPKWSSGPMSAAERARDYRSRKTLNAKLVGLRGLNDNAPSLTLSDVELHEAIRIAMQTRNGKRVAMLCDELKRRFK